MSHQRGYGDGPQAPRTAIIDLIRYIGKSRTICLMRGIRSGATLEQTQFYASFAGVNGYPIGALFRYVTGELPALKKEVTR